MLDMELYLAIHNCRTHIGVRQFCARAHRFYSGYTLEILRNLGRKPNALVFVDTFWAELDHEWGPHAAE